MKYLRQHSKHAKRLMILPLALAALIGYTSMRGTNYAKQVEVQQSSFEQLSRSGESLKATRAALDQVIAREKSAPSEEASHAADVALRAYNESRADRLKAVARRKKEVESSVREIVSKLGLEARQLRESPETAPLMAEHDELTSEFLALSHRTPVGELEGNDSVATADRIIGGGPETGARSGVIAPGDVDFYSIEAEEGEVLNFHLTINQVGGKKSGRITLDLLAPDGMTSLFTITSKTEKASGKLPDFTVPESGKYFVEVKSASSRRTSGYELMVRRARGDFSIAGAGTQVCTTFDFESGAAGFTVEPVFDVALWHLTDPMAPQCGAELMGHSATTTFYYGIECNNGSTTQGTTFSSQKASGPAAAGSGSKPAASATTSHGDYNPHGNGCGSTCDYNTGSRNASNLVSPAVNVTSPASLTFNYLLFVESTTNVDLAFVDVSTDGGTTWANVLNKTDLINDNTWHTANVDISSFVGAATSVNVRFGFDSVDSLFNNTTGWHIDDVQICGESLCTITCPPNQTVSNDPNQCGAVVNYPAPTSSGNCGTITCSPASGSFFPVGTTTVTCMTTAGPSCSFTITVVDTQPPQITCPANVTAIAAPTCPPSASTVVTFPPPTASDNCPGVTTSCNPPSGSPLPVGTTTVTCTATDASGNTATCSFTVTVFNGCLQDDANPGNVVLFNTFTGDYIFCCGGVVIKSGKGTVLAQGCNFTITHNTADRRVAIQVSFTTKNGSASLQAPPGTIRCRITDRNITNNTCQCPAVVNGKA